MIAVTEPEGCVLLHGTTATAVHGPTMFRAVEPRSINESGFGGRAGGPTHGSAALRGTSRVDHRRARSSGDVPLAGVADQTAPTPTAMPSAGDDSAHAIDNRPTKARVPRCGKLPLSFRANCR